MGRNGIIAAGALYALEHHRARLAEDHANARVLAQGLARLPGLEIDPGTVETNIVMFRATARPAPELAQRLNTAGVRVLAAGPDTIRAVTNLNVSVEDIVRALAIIERVVTS